MLSGAGRTLANLLDHAGRGTLHASVSLVIASGECPGADLARARGLETLVIPGRIPASQLAGVLLARRIDWVVLAGYLRLVDIPPEYAGRVVNIHPALLPRHGGPGMHGLKVHAAVLAAGDARSGATVHFCDETFDTGSIIRQAECPVLPGDTPETLAARVFEVERALYPAALESLLTAHPGPLGARAGFGYTAAAAGEANAAPRPGPKP